MESSWLINTLPSGSSELPEFLQSCDHPENRLKVLERKIHCKYVEHYIDRNSCGLINMNQQVYANLTGGKSVFVFPDAVSEMWFDHNGLNTFENLPQIFDEQHDADYSKSNAISIDNNKFTSIEGLTVGTKVLHASHNPISDFGVLPLTLQELRICNTSERRYTSISDSLIELDTSCGDFENIHEMTPNLKYLYFRTYF